MLPTLEPSKPWYERWKETLKIKMRKPVKSEPKSEADLSEQCCPSGSYVFALFIVDIRK
jgi:hypothetical protein